MQVNLGSRRTLGGLIAATLGLAHAVLAMPAAAQDWPQRPITIVVSQSAGASPDVMARLIANRLSQELAPGVVIENKPGGGNVIGANAVARAAPDGLTFFFATSAALVANPVLMKALPYDPARDFVPVALMTRSHQLIVVHPDVPVKTLAELIARDKAQPGKLSIAVDGPRNLAGVIGQALNKRAGTAFVPVPYPNINAGLQDVVAGRVEVGVFSVSVAEALVREGKLRAIAVASKDRIASLPDVPPAADTLAGFDFPGWFMVMAPAGTPRAIVERMNGLLDQAARDAKVRELAPKLGFEMNAKGVGSPEDAALFLKEQLALWQTTARELGLEPQ